MLVVEDTGIDVVVAASGRVVADSSAEHAGMASAISATRALTVPTFMARPGPESSVVEQLVSAWVLSASSYEITEAMKKVAATWESQRQEPSPRTTEPPTCRRRRSRGRAGAPPPR